MVWADRYINRSNHIKNFRYYELPARQNLFGYYLGQPGLKNPNKLGSNLFEIFVEYLIDYTF